MAIGVATFVADDRVTVCVCVLPACLPACLRGHRCVVVIVVVVVEMMAGAVVVNHYHHLFDFELLVATQHHGTIPAMVIMVRYSEYRGTSTLE